MQYGDFNNLGRRSKKIYIFLIDQLTTLRGSQSINDCHIVCQCNMLQNGWHFGPVTLGRCLPHSDIFKCELSHGNQSSLTCSSKHTCVEISFPTESLAFPRIDPLWRFFAHSAILSTSCLGSQESSTKNCRQIKDTPPPPNASC